MNRQTVVASAANSVSNSFDSYNNSPYHRCMVNPNTSYSDCQGLSTSG